MTGAVAALQRLDAYVRARGYGGPDPYDGLLSPWSRLCRGPRSRQLLVQTVKRSPVNLRRLLRVPPLRMAKGLALFCSGLSRVSELPDAAARAASLATELAEQRAYGDAWGYEFDVQTRWGYYRAHTPNIISTSFVVEALHDTGTLQGADPAVAWMNEFMVHPAGFIRYTPTSDRLIHNANLLGARALARMDPGHPAIHACVRTTVNAQRSDGLWPYGQDANLDWVDNFHSAYVLLALDELDQAYGDFSDALDRGIDAWTSRCFEPDGRPRYFADRSGKVDVHNVATATFALAVFADRYSAARHRLEGAFAHLTSLQRPDGAFAAGREPAYMRWNQAHAFRALAEMVKR